MNATRYWPLIAAVFAITVSGCESSDISSAPAATGIGNTGRVIVYTRPAGVNRTTVSSEERMAMHRQSTSELRQVSSILKTSETWQDADARMRALVSSAPDQSRENIEQTAAAYMLQSGALDGEDTPDRLDAVGYYVDLLARNDSPDSPMVASALDRLVGYWTPEQVAAAATRTAAAGEAALQARAAHRSSGPESRSRVLSARIGPEQDRRNGIREEAVEHLRQSAGSADV